MQYQYANYSGSITRAIEEHTVIKGMNEDQVLLSLGSTICKTYQYENQRAITIWLYMFNRGRNRPFPVASGQCPLADYMVYFENGIVVEEKLKTDH